MITREWSIHLGPFTFTFAKQTGCGCECNYGGFCGGCGHRGCGGR